MRELIFCVNVGLICKRDLRCWLLCSFIALSECSSSLGAAACCSTVFVVAQILNVVKLYVGRVRGVSQCICTSFLVN